MEYLTLTEALEAFNAPINEEQAWAVCYQCAKFLQTRWKESPEDCFQFSGLNSVTVEINKDGNIVDISRLPNSEDATATVTTEYELVQSLGVVVYQALDWGLSENEEQKLSVLLEQLIEQMTVSDAGDEDARSEGDHDEGIENDEDDEATVPSITMEDVIKMCANHLELPHEAPQHYRAVCRALVAEAQELRSFLTKIREEKTKLKIDRGDGVSEEDMMEELEQAEWARLWIQIMRELRNGVKLKKVKSFHCASVEFELTPYEILMEDIRSRRYSLNKVMVNGSIPQQAKKDAHDIILEFIRSRPPLHPVKDRVLNSPPVKSPDPREQLLDAIRAEPRLRPTPGRTVETSRTKLDETDSNPAPARKVIKPDLSLLMSTSFDEEDEDDDLFEDRNKVEPEVISPMTPLQSPDTPTQPSKQTWQKTVAFDLLNESISSPPERRHSISVCETPTTPTSKVSFVPERRHSITVCESPSLRRRLTSGGGSAVDGGDGASRKPSTSHSSTLPHTNTYSKPMHSSLECLSLTIEEVMHIRNVLTKAELECLILDPELQALLAKGKVCFTCKKTKFSWFGQWGTRCKFCRRNVCSKCISKMRIPTEHFEHIPVYTLSPSPMSPSTGRHVELFSYEKSGSVPTTPEGPQYRAGMSAQTPPDVINNNRNKQRPPLQRARTITRAPPPRAIQGPLMNICKDCKTMIVNIIRASRTSLASAPDIMKEPLPMEYLPSHRAERNFHLDLKPVYK